MFVLNISEYRDETCVCLNISEYRDETCVCSEYF